MRLLANAPQDLRAGDIILVKLTVANGLDKTVVVADKAHLLADVATPTPVSTSEVPIVGH